MRAKQLEAMLSEELEIGEAEMVQRFQKLRDYRLLTTSRGRNAEDISYQEIVLGLCSIVAERPGFAGHTATILRDLRPVGGSDSAFAKAPTFGQAMVALLENETLLDTLVEIRISDSEIYTNSHGRAAIVFKDRDRENVTYYVGRTAVSLFQPGKEKDYNPRDLISSMIRETVIFPNILKRIARELRDNATYKQAIERPIPVAR